jgi:hypothetical protein
VDTQEKAKQMLWSVQGATKQYHYFVYDTINKHFLSTVLEAGKPTLKEPADLVLHEG